MHHRLLPECTCYLPISKKKKKLENELPEGAAHKWMPEKWFTSWRGASLPSDPLLMHPINLAALKWRLNHIWKFVFRAVQMAPIKCNDTAERAALKGSEREREREMEMKNSSAKRRSFSRGVPFTCTVCSGVSGAHDSPFSICRASAPPSQRWHYVTSALWCAMCISIKCEIYIFCINTWRFIISFGRVSMCFSAVRNTFPHTRASDPYLTLHNETDSGRKSSARHRVEWLRMKRGGWGNELRLVFLWIKILWPRNSNGYGSGWVGAGTRGALSSSSPSFDSRLTRANDTC